MTGKTGLFFDESLPAFVKAVSAEFGPEILAQGLVLRDTSGRLSFLNPQESPSDEDRSRIEQRLSQPMGAYVRPDRVVAFSDEPGIGKILDDDATAFPMEIGAQAFRLLDRRIVGSAWVDRPQNEMAVPPRIVFASLKGGVGRSTALAVTAADLARRNKNVLVIDLDLEAPGLGDLLLGDDRTPRFGLIDYLVENGLGGVPDQRLADFVGTSSLTAAAGGRVDVLPALGLQAIANPGNTLAKLARAMIEDVTPDGAAVSVAQQIAAMIGRFAQRNTYDLVLIDSRAGLSELAAPAIIGLGATTLFFGTAQKQTIQGYDALFAGLKLLAQRDRAAGRPADWRLMLKAVHAKAGLDAQTLARHRDDLYELFADIYDADEGGDGNPEAISFGIDDANAPHWPLIIPFMQGLIDFDPVRRPNQLSFGFYEQAFRPFLNGIDAIIDSSAPASK